MKDNEEAKQLMEYANFKNFVNNKHLFCFLDFSKDFADIEVKLKQLTKDNFVIVPT